MHILVRCIQELVKQDLSRKYVGSFQNILTYTRYYVRSCNKILHSLNLGKDLKLVGKNLIKIHKILPEFFAGSIHFRMVATILRVRNVLH